MITALPRGATAGVGAGAAASFFVDGNAAAVVSIVETASLIGSVFGSVAGSAPPAETMRGGTAAVSEDTMAVAGAGPVEVLFAGVGVSLDSLLGVAFAPTTNGAVPTATFVTDGAIGGAADVFAVAAGGTSAAAGLFAGSSVPLVLSADETEPLPRTSVGSADAGAVLAEALFIG